MQEPIQRTQYANRNTLYAAWIPLGEAIEDYYNGNHHAALYIKSTIEADRAMPVDIFFRDNNKFPKIEKEAFKYCRGKILDVGAGAGAHSLFLQKKGFDITPMDISAKAVEVMRQRGVKTAFSANIFEYTGDTFDTVLMMMNGIGVAGDIPGLARLLQHLKTILKPGGQILFDSTDISYVTPHDRFLGSLRMDNPEYYGCVHYQLEFRAFKGEIYPWLYIDRKLMAEIAEANGYECKVLKKTGSQYLASLTIRQ